MIRLRATLPVLFFAACNAPHIPLPPPDPDDLVIDIPSAGSFVVRAEPAEAGGATTFPPRSRVEIENLDASDPSTSAGVIVYADDAGAFAAGPIQGELGDRLTIAFTAEDGSRSGLLCLRVREARRQSQGDLCSIGP